MHHRARLWHYKFFTFQWQCHLVSSCLQKVLKIALLDLLKEHLRQHHSWHWYYLYNYIFEIKAACRILNLIAANGRLWWIFFFKAFDKRVEDRASCYTAFLQKAVDKMRSEHAKSSCPGIVMGHQMLTCKYVYLYICIFLFYRNDKCI